MEKRKLYHHVSEGLGSRGSMTYYVLQRAWRQRIWTLMSGIARGFWGDPFPVHTPQKLSLNLSANTFVYV